MAIRIPPELAKAVANGRAVLFVGAGMSRPQLPGWVDLLKKMAEWASAKGIAPPPEIDRLIEKGKLMLAAEKIGGCLGEKKGECLRELLAPAGLRHGPAHELAWQLPFAAVVTTNFDQLLEAAAPTGVPMYTWRDAEGMTRVGAGSERALVKIHGDVMQPETVILGLSEYRRLLFSNEPLKRFIQSLLYGKTILFIGYGLSDYDLDPLMEEMQFFLPKGRPGDYALFDTRELTGAEIDDYRGRLGIELVYDPNATSFPDYAAFLRQLQVELPAPEVVVERPASEADIDDIRRLLEDSGQKEVFPTRVGDGACFLGQVKVGVALREIVTHFVPRAARVEDLDLQTDGRSEVQLIAGAIPDAVRTEAARRGVAVYTRDEFVGRLVDFSPHHAELAERHRELEIEKYFVPLDAEREGSSARTSLDAAVDAWIAAPGRSMLSVLGDFGTGKTWFVRHLAKRLIERSGRRVPLLVLLRDYSKAYDMSQALTDATVNRGVSLPAGIQTLKRLNAEGRLVLIFDGFDEMERRVSDHQTAEENFKRIEEWAVPGAKVLLTCRTEFFRSRSHEKDVLESSPQVRVHRGQAEVELGKQPESIRLAPFSEHQLQEAFRLRLGAAWKDAYAKVEAIPGLKGLADRPVLIEMITRSWKSLEGGGPVNLAKLYGAYAEDLLKLRPEDTIGLDRRLAFVEMLAFDMQKSGGEKLVHTDFKDRVQTQFELDGERQIDYWETQVRTGSLLRRDAGGVYEFAHKSMREYFTARRLASRLLAGDAEEMTLTDAIGRFTHELLAEQVRYEVREENGMVWVPPGPFLYGSDSEKNMRVKTLPGFWIDKYPVTNEEFCRFLNEKTNWIPGRNWHDESFSKLRAASSRWKSRWEVEPGFERHPVTGVTWHGASAYAKWAGKRLPTEEEWEKAARGIDGREYPWGMEFDHSRCNTAESGTGGTSEVGTFDPMGLSPYGASDMAGNVWDWTASPWDAQSFVLRGGSFNFIRVRARGAFRAYFEPGGRNYVIGFRSART